MMVSCVFFGRGVFCELELSENALGEKEFLAFDKRLVNDIAKFAARTASLSTFTIQVRKIACPLPKM